MKNKRLLLALVVVLGATLLIVLSLGKPNETTSEKVLSLNCPGCDQAGVGVMIFRRPTTGGDGELVGIEPHGTRCTYTTKTVIADGSYWWQVACNNTRGWVEDHLITLP